MFSLDTLLQDAFPDRAPPAWQRKLLRSLLFEKEFKQFAEDYPHLKGCLLYTSLTKTAKGYRLNNTTPFNLTVIGFGGSKSQSEKSAFDVVMLPPKSTHELSSAALATPYLTYINDYGGKPTLVFNCQGDTCSVTGEK